MTGRATGAICLALGLVLCAGAAPAAWRALEDAPAGSVAGPAEAEAEAALARAPLDGAAWLRLARARLERDPGDLVALDAVGRSIAVAPRDYALMPERLLLSLNAWTLLDAALAEAVREEVLLAAEMIPRALAEATLAAAREGEVRAMLSLDPALAGDFGRHLDVVRALRAARKGAGT